MQHREGVEDGKTYIKTKKVSKKNMQFERVPPKQLIDLKETQFFHITTYTNKLTGSFFCIITSWEIITRKVFQLQTSTRKQQLKHRHDVQQFNIASVLFSKYLMKHNFYHTSWLPKTQQLICYIFINTVLTGGVVIIKHESHSFNRAAGRLSGARL